MTTNRHQTSDMRCTWRQLDSISTITPHRRQKPTLPGIRVISNRIVAAHLIRLPQFDCVRVRHNLIPRPQQSFRPLDILPHPPQLFGILQLPDRQSLPLDQAQDPADDTADGAECDDLYVIRSSEGAEDYQD